MITVAIVITFPPSSISPDSLISIYISSNWSGKKEHISGNVTIRLKKGKAHNIINGTIAAVAVERAAADTTIASIAANNVPI